MQKRVFLIHGWEGNSQNAWFPWLEKELSKLGYKVFVPDMPGTNAPEMQAWISHLNDTVGELDENTYFVGHSIGCQAILRYIERFARKPIGGIVCVAGFFNLRHLETVEERKIAKPWLETKMDFKKIKKNAQKITAIFSDDDPEVDLEDKELFEKYLSAKTILEHKKGHFSDDEKVHELPSVFNAIFEMSN